MTFTRIHLLGSQVAASKMATQLIVMVQSSMRREDVQADDDADKDTRQYSHDATCKAATTATPIAFCTATVRTGCDTVIVPC